jgi:Ca2+-binding RTX toxin-like protein
LFGNRTTSGFAMLSGYDVNADGKIDSQDAVYADLRVWQDADQDGVSDAGELKGLAELGIASISLANAAPAEPTDVGGNAIVHEGSFTWANGTTGRIADVAFQIDETSSRWMGDTTVSATAAALPQLKGFGEVKDLRVAITADAALQSLVQDFVGETTNDLATLKRDAESILFKWAGVDGVAATAIGADGFDTRKLAFLEKYSGYQLMPRAVDGTLQTDNLSEMETLWNDQVTRLTLRLIVQGPLHDTFAGISYHADIDLLVGDTPTALRDLYHQILADLPSDPAAALAQWQGWAPLLGAMADGMRRFDANMVFGDYVATELLASMYGVTQPLAFADLAGALGIETLRIGTTAAETLSRGSADGTTILVGGGGDDHLTGGTGQDVYLFGHAIGHSVIDDVEAKQAGDRISFAFLSPGDVTLSRDGADLLITVRSSGETIRVLGQFADVVPLSSDVLLSPNRGNEDIQSGDGTVSAIPDNINAVGTGTDGNDHMVGTMHSDVLIGGKGDDRLEGGDDADLYVIRAGDGHDVISDVQTTPLLRAADLLIFGDGLAPDDLGFSRSGDGGDNLLVTIGTTGQTLTIEGQFAYTSLGYNAALAPNDRIEAFAFKEYGDSWGYKDLQQRMIAEATTAGDDTTRGFGDDDQFGASAGNDLLIGMDGIDTYHWGAGAGNDVIHEQARYIDINVGLGGLSLTYGADTLVFDGGIVRSDLIFSRGSAAPNLTITLVSTGETITILNQFAGFQTGPLGPQWMDRVEWFEFADGSRISWQDVLHDITTGGPGADLLWGDLFADTLVGAAGNDRLSGLGLGDTYLFGIGDGQDTLADDNQSILGSGFVTLDTAPDILQLGPGIAPSDISFLRSGKDLTLVIGTTGDRVTLEGQDDYFHTGVFGAIAYNRIEEVHFADGTIWTWQDLNQHALDAATTAGSDTTSGFMMADRFKASAGDDVMMGGDSGDTYAFGPGSGHDIVRESVSNPLYGDEDAVEFAAGVLPGDVTITRSGGDLILTLAATGDSLTIEGEFGFDSWFTWTDVELFRFSNGDQWTKDDIQVRLLQATSGDDHLVGFMTADTLDGGAGNDILEGGDGGDSYRFGRGSGSDVIRESVSNANLGDGDRLVFGAGVLPADLQVSREGDDLVIAIAGTSDLVRVAGQFSYSSWFAWSDVERFEFANGIVWTDTDVAAMIGAGTAGDDHIIGTFRSDTIDGGAGNDLLEGGDGADIYVFGRGYGQDEIRESVSNAILSEDDALAFRPGITLADLGFSQVGNDLVISILGTADKITIKGEFNYDGSYTWQDVERFVLDGGQILLKTDIQQILLASTPGADHLVGYNTGDTLDGGAGNDILEGGDGGDTYVFGRGYGQDVIVESVHYAILPDTDTIRFGTGVTLSDLGFVRSGNSLIIGIAGTSDSLTIVDHWLTITDQSSQSWTDVETFLLADGTVLTARDVDQLYIAQAKTNGDDVIQGTIYADRIEGGDGNDILRGGNSDDILDGGPGNDRLEGGAGADTHVYASGSDTIVETPDGAVNRIRLPAGITAADLIVTGNPADATTMRIAFAGRAGTIDVPGQWSPTAANIAIQVIDFADGSHWSAADLAAAFVASEKTSGNDTIYGTALADTIDGGAGTDSLIGGLGDDVYRFGRGSGVDTILDQGPQYWWGWESGGNDRIELGAGIAAADVEVFQQGATDLVIQITGTTDKLILSGAVNDATKRIEEVRFADGTSWNWSALLAATLLGTSANDTISAGETPSTIGGKGGNDTLYGSGGNDVIIGGPGNDNLFGGTGNDLYRFARGDGVDTILDRGNQQWWGFPDGGIDRIEFAAGIAPADIQVLELNGDDLALQIAGTSDRIVISGELSDPVRRIETVAFADGTVWTWAEIFARAIAPTGGNDTIWAGNTPATLLGAGGNDTLYGSVGTDTFDGGAGNDSLNGGLGDDVYRFGRGSGVDTVYDQGPQYWWGFASGGYDRVELAADIAPADVKVVELSADNIALQIVGASDQLILTGDLSDATRRIEEVRFADGTVWTYADVLARATTPTTGNDTFWAGDTALTLSGGAGDDILNGSVNGDILIGGTGNDTLYGGKGDDGYRFAWGDGADTILDRGWQQWWGFESGGTDRIELGAGIAPGDVALFTTNGGGDLVLALNGSDDVVTILGGTVDASRIEEVRFADGTIWTYTDMAARIAGSFTSAADTISGTAGDDDRRGGGGNDAIAGLAGNDRIGGDAGDDRLDGGDGNDFVFGGAGNDQIKGSAGDDRLAGGAGNDSLFGGGGDDVAIFTGALADYQISVSGNVVTVAGGVDGTDFLTGIEHLQFSDGTIAAPALTSGLAGLDLFTAIASPVSQVIGNATALAGGTYRLTPDANYQTGAIWGSVDLSRDVIWSARLNFGTNDGGDGIGFALANVSQLTAQSLGSYGVEFHGTFGIRFATWSNWWEGNPGVDFGQFLLNGNLSGSQTGFGPYLPIGELEGGAWHEATIAWDAETKTLSYTLDGQFTQSKSYDVSANLLGGGMSAAFGFGASTGGLSNNHQVQINSVLAWTQAPAVDDLAGAGTLVAKLLAASLNPGDTLSYAIVDSTGAPTTSALFEIANGDQIVVRNGAQLTGLEGTVSDLWILVSNSSGETLLQDIPIHII